MNMHRNWHPSSGKTCYYIDVVNSTIVEAFGH